MTTALSALGALTPLRDLSTLANGQTGSKPGNCLMSRAGACFAGVGVMVIDDHGQLLYCSPECELVCGVAAEKLKGRVLESVFTSTSGEVPDLQPPRGQNVKDLQLKGVFALAGDARQVSMTLSPVRHGRRWLYVACVRDANPAVNEQPQLQQLSQALDRSQNAIIICDRESRIQYVNAGFTEMFGHAAKDAAGVTLGELIGGEHTDLQQLAHYSDSRHSSRPHQADLLLYRDDGTPLWVRSSSTPLPDSEGQLNRFVTILNDITEAKTRELLHDRILDALVREQPLHDSMTQICREVERVAPDLIASVVAVDPEHRLRPLAGPSMPQAFSEYIDGVPIGPAVGSCGTSAWRGRPVVVADIATDPLYAPYAEAALACGLRACWSNPIKSSSNQVMGTLAFYYREPREPAPWHVKLAELCVHLCALAMEREQTKARVHQLAFYDVLTGLPNRMMFNARAEQALATAEHNGEPVAILFVDIDRFKRINETQGHSAGDGLLRDIARRLGECAGYGALVGRQAGDEFVMLVPQCGAEHAAGLSERLLASLGEALVVGNVTVHTSASIGVAMFPDDGRDIDTLLRHADLAMIQAKDEGGGSVRFFSLEMNRLAQERIAMETALREALRRDQLQLHYQPQLASVDHRLYGVEALLRWEHPTMGPVSPARFVPMAEECGLIDEMSDWVLRRACRQMADWRARSIMVPRVAVNLSAGYFENPTLPLELQQLLDANGLKPQDLVLEITESVMLSPQARVLQNLDAIQQMGIGLSLDDFGTGYSSLSHLHRLPIDELKLDMSFVRDIEHSDTARTLITSVLRIGENLRKHVVAEGVETEEQHRFLAEQGCEVLQGYLFSKPLPVPRLEEWLKLGRD